MIAPPDIIAADLVAFVQHEARLIDEQRFEDWLALFTEDARYWMPLDPAQTDYKLHQSLYIEDPVLLRLRVERLKGAKTYSQKPKSRCHHLLQTPLVEQADQEVRSPSCPWAVFLAIVRVRQVLRPVRRLQALRAVTLASGTCFR